MITDNIRKAIIIFIERSRERYTYGGTPWKRTRSSSDTENVYVGRPWPARARDYTHNQCWADGSSEPRAEFRGAPYMCFYLVL
jgi:hypothetical protein